MRISDWSSDVCSSDLVDRRVARIGGVDLKRRRQLLELHDVEIAGRLYAVAPDDGDRQRHFLRGFGAAAGGDEDHLAPAGGVFVAFAIVRGGLGRCLRGRAGQNGVATCRERESHTGYISGVAEHKKNTTRE